MHESGYLPHSEGLTSGAKFLCQNMINNTQTTKEWLSSIQALKIIEPYKATGMNGKKILQGIFQKDRNVVVKIATTTEDIEIEWTTYAKLKESGVSLVNFVEYLCFFRCSDSITRVVQEIAKQKQPIEEICGPDDGKPKMQVLVMEYVDGRSMKNYLWNDISIEALRSCMLQVVFAITDANVKCGFVHGDLHMDNVIVDSLDVSKGSHVVLEYINLPEQFRNIVAHDGRVAKIMDFEFSKIIPGDSRVGLYKDMREFFNKSMTCLVDYLVTTAPLHQCFELAAQYAADPPDDHRFLEFVVNKIQLLKFKGTRGGGQKGPRPVRHKGPYLSKRNGVW